MTDWLEKIRGGLLKNYAICPVFINRDQIESVERMSKNMVVLTCPHPVYISNVFNNEIDLLKKNFNRIELRRCYDNIFYDIRVEPIDEKSEFSIKN